LQAQRSGPRLPWYVGVRARAGEGFLLETPSKDSFLPDGSLIWPVDNGGAEDGDLHEDCDVRFFHLSLEECRTDLTRLLGYVRAQCEEKEEQVLGALMFTCNARGRQFFGEDCVDAKQFQTMFPTLPLIGFWAGGEIGPQAVAEAAPEQATRTGRAALQGFTAVFGIFRAPLPTARSTLITLADEEVPNAVGEVLHQLAKESKERGNAAFKEGAFASSLVHYTRAVDIAEVSSAQVSASDRSTIYSNRAMSKIKAEDYQGALEDAQKAIDLDPLNGKAHFRMGTALLQMNRAKEATSVFP